MERARARVHDQEVAVTGLADHQRVEVDRGGREEELGDRDHGEVHRPLEHALGRIVARDREQRVVLAARERPRAVVERDERAVTGRHGVEAGLAVSHGTAATVGVGRASGIDPAPARLGAFSPATGVARPRSNAAIALGSTAAKLHPSGARRRCGS